MGKINVLWTGGFDSTFRVCQLSLLNVEIQPFYVSLRRKSESYEIRAINKITDFINSRKETRCNLLPLIIVKYDEILPDSQVTGSFNALRKKYKIGYQYDFLSRFARQYNIMPEIGCEINPSSGEMEVFEKYAKVKKETISVSESENIEYYVLVPDECPEDFMNLFGEFRYGIPLYDMNKHDTVKAYRELGFEKVINMTWFCAHPLMGKPCGLCTPCEQVIKEGMAFRLPIRSRIIYKIFKDNTFGKSINEKLKAIYNKRFRDTDPEKYVFK
ncbi:MAG: 7-cyano-7-deazaguanine synthase [Bacteroidales bacterium]|nr:7-cyano-7-deazaguanine synthase [Bacteroidales bacterium]